MTGNKKMEEEVVRSFKTMVDSVPQLRSEYSIYRVPERLRNVNEEAYTPMVVSIGPYHRGKEKYKTMEYHKLRYSKKVCDQSLLLQECVKLVLGWESWARECYAENINFTTEQFIKMMLVDGFFIVELIRKCHNRHLILQVDPIFKNDWIFSAVHRDMLLLENQLPFPFLERLFTLINNSDDRFRTERTFLQLANDFLGKYQLIRQCPGNSVGLHLLHLSQQGFIPPGDIHPFIIHSETELHEAGIPSVTELHEAGIPSATELHEAGIKFHKVPLTTSNDSEHLLVVEFIKGVLHIPPLVVDDRTESLFRNLVALEQSHGSSFINDLPENSTSNRALWIRNHLYGGSTSTPVTDYVTLMDCLINTAADVALLRKRGIIQNLLGDNEEVAQIFNKLRSGIIVRSTKFYFDKLFVEVNELYNNRWHAWKAKLMRDYFNTPWASVSFVAAVFLLICTFVQTVFSILQVVKK